MSTIVQKSLQLETDNVEQYCSADGLSLNAGGYAIRKWLNGSNSGYATLNDAAKNILYPTSTAHPFKLDSEIRGSRSAGSMTVNLEFGGTVVHSESFTSISLSTKTKTDITDSVVTDSSRNTQIRWNVQGKNGDIQRIAHVKLVLYFYQYAMSANIGTGANGLQSVSVSDSAPYQGDTVTFTPKLVNGATWDGWYSDAGCTNLVSTSQDYSVNPSSDITLYAKATIDAVVYNCSAVAGENIASASVSDDSVVSGESTIFTAVPSEHCTFDGWFSDSNYATLVSIANPYTATITSDTTLYAKGTKISYSVRVGIAEHGTATASANTAHYGDRVTFTFTPEDNTWELYGWYSDEGFTQLVSESNPYTYSVTGNVTLYPKVGRIRYNITLTTSTAYYHNSRNEIISYDYALLTETEISYLKTGEFDKIDQNKIYDRSSVEGTQFTTQHTASIKCPFGYAISIYLKPSDQVVPYISLNGADVTAWPYYTTFPTEDQAYLTVKGAHPCYCDAVIVDGIISTDATTPVSQEKEARFTAEVMPGYTFSGWYVDQACTRLTSADNPAYVKTPKFIGDTPQAVSVTLYAKATKIGAGTGLYIKQNGSYVEANAVYKRIDGAWVQLSNSELIELKSEMQSGNYRVATSDQ